jgi:hypothetical protein
MFHTVKKFGFIGVVICFTLAPPMRGQIVSLLPVPSCSPEQSSRLQPKWNNLQSTASALVDKGETFNRDCNRVEEGSAEDTACKQRSDALETERQDYNGKANGYNSDVVAVLHGCVDDLTALVARDQQAIRNLGIDRTAQQFEQWVDWASSATEERDEQWREALQESAKAIVEAAIKSATDHTLDAVGSLNPPTANRLITQLRSAGVSDPLLFDAIRTVAYTPDKPGKARAAKKIIENLWRMKELWDLKDLTSSTESSKWKAGAAVIGLFVVDPRFQLLGKLTLQDVRFAFYSVNANVATRISLSEIERLSDLTELQLQNLKSLSRQLQGDVQRLRATKQELAGAGG